MSLIQEALRRQQEDMDDNSGVQAASATPKIPAPDPKEAPTIARKAPISMVPPNMDTSAPPPVQHPPTVEEEEPPPPPDVSSDDETPPAAPSGASKESKPGAKLTLIIVGAILCLGLGVWAVTFAIQNYFVSSPNTETPAGHGTVDTGTPAPVTPPDGATPPAEPIPVVVQPVAPIQQAHQPVAPPVEPAPVIKEPVLWPILVIDGLVGKGAQGAVMINASIVGVGETIEGVRIMSIDKQGCKLEYEGETKSVKVGGSTE